MTDITNIPLNKLTAWEGNVRKTQNKASIDELAANINAIGLQQNLVVIKTGKTYAVVAGGRRLAALQKLAKNGDIKENDEIPCRIVEESEAAEISLAENAIRENMHPADECEAYAKLADDDMPIIDIAARFGKTERYVQQRLRLARGISPKVMKKFRSGDITLQHAEAFTVTEDFKAQDKVLENLDPEYDDADDIRRQLTAEDIAASHPMVKLVTLEAYEKAGGTLKKDLFADEDDVYICNYQLLKDLAQAKLEKTAKTVEKEGWKWVEVQVERSRDLYNMQRVYAKKDKWSKEQLSYAGAVITVGSGGKAEIERGLVKRGDMPKPKKETAEGDDTPAQEANGLPKKLQESLDSEYQLALIAHTMDHPAKILPCIAYTVAEDIFGYGSDDLFDIHFGELYLGDDDGLSPAEKTIFEARKYWGEQLPEDSDERRKWFFEQDTKTLLKFIGFCGSISISIRSGKGRDQAEELAKHTGFDIKTYFTPTAENYFGNIGKPQILEALQEAKGQPPAPAWEKLKKGELAKLAEREIAGTGWLPKPLRPVA